MNDFSLMARHLCFVRNLLFGLIASTLFATMTFAHSHSKMLPADTLMPAEIKDSSSHSTNDYSYEWRCSSSAIGTKNNGGVLHYHEGLVLRGCTKAHFVPSHFFYLEDSVKSKGYTVKCHPIQTR